MQKKSLVFLMMSIFITGITMAGCTMTGEKNDYPNKPINVIVPFSAGGGTDLQARALEKLAPKYLNQNFIILNKPGGSCTIGLNELVTASPDGYTIGLSPLNLILQPLYGATKYHYPTALEPIVQISTTPSILVVNANHSWETLDDLITYCNQHPREIKFGHSGIGDSSHIIGEIFAKKANIEIEQVPFRGASESISALLGDHVQFIIASPGALTEQIKSGKLKALAISGEKHLSNSALSKIPTFQELGFDIVLENWYGIAAPKEIDAKTKNKLVESLKNMISDPDFKTNLDQLGMEVSYLNSEETKKKWISDTEKLTNILKETNIIEQIQAQKQ